MERMAKFLKVSEENFISSLDGFSKDESKKIYEDIKLPLRATKYSAGYDFYAPFDFTLKPGETIKIPTGIRAKMREDYALFLLPRSGLGFKYRLQLNNTIGLIDADYFYSDNEGHIFAKITNDSNEGKVISVKKGEAFIQGVFLSYRITEDDEVNTIRNGGFGSTSK